MKINNPEESKVLIKAKATYYRGFIRVWIPDQPYLRHPTGTEPKVSNRVSLRLDSDEDTVLYETNLERSLRRTKKTIKDYVHMNDFDWFITFTFATERFEDNRSRQKMATWLRNQRKRNGKFRYVIVAEKHKNGALHFHGLVGGYEGRLTFAINPHTGLKIPDGRGDYVYNLVEFRLGYTTAKKITDNIRSVLYLLKYVTKENITEFGKNRYWASKNLNRPQIEENPQPFYKQIWADRHYVLDHGTILEFDKNKHELIDIFIEAHQNE